MNSIINGKEITVRGTLLRTARLRHEWCQFLDRPADEIEELRRQRPIADVFTFVREISDPSTGFSFHSEPATVAVLPVATYQKWWDEMGFKARNKVRKGLKSGVQIRSAELTHEFAQGVESIYNETPVKQGRRFYHYGKTAREIEEELASFRDQSLLVGAYWQGELIGFMKLFRGKSVLRTVHIIVKTAHRDKCVMDALIAKGVELCEENEAEYLHYGSWTEGGIGAFREKHGFRKMDVPRYFVPLTFRGELIIGLGLHRPIRDRLPQVMVKFLKELRGRLTEIKYGGAVPSALRR
jgi:hypothetical protein